MVFRVEDQVLSHWLPAAVGEGLLRVSAIDDQVLRLELAHRGDISQRAVEDYLSEWWDLRRDMAPFYNAFAHDPLLRDRLRQHHGARIVGIPDLFEAMTLGILGQQVNVSFAFTLKHRITEAFGQAFQHQGKNWWRFPRAEDLAGARPDHLRNMQISQRKVEYLLAVADAIAQGRLGRQQLLSMPFPDQIAAMTAIRGIGNWTAHYTAMKCLYQPQAFPAGDAGLQNAVKSILTMDQKPSVPVLIDIAKSWCGWEAYAVWFLWMGDGAKREL